MNDTLCSRILEHVRQEVVARFGERVWSVAQSTLRRNLKAFLDETERAGAGYSYEDEGDLRAIAIDLLRARLCDLEDIAGRVKERRRISHSPRDRGSLQNLQAYATALPIATKARMALLGRREPLPMDEAVKWLRRNAGGATDEWWTELTLTVRIPHSWEREHAALKHRHDLDGAMDVLEDSRHDVLGVEFSAWGAGPHKVWLLGGVPRFELSKQIGELRRKDAEVEVIRLDGEPLQDLAEYAERLTKQCGGEEAEGFERAVWLILTGKWYSIGAMGQHDTFRDWRLIHDPREVVNRPAPHVTLRIYEMETTPSEVEALYRQVRANMNLAKPGPKIPRRNELLGLLAVDVATREGKRMGDRGFSRSVLGRWREAAPRYGFAEDEFDGVDAIRYALAGLRKQLEKQDQAITADGPGVVRSGLFW